MKILAILLVLLSASGANAGSTIVGAGSQSCTAWTNRKKNPVVKGSFESWLVGFISGPNVSGDLEMIGGQDFNAMTEWVDERCLAHPADTIGIAALDMGMELAKKAERGRPSGSGQQLHAPLRE
jgi:hypothetical protein